MFNFRPLGFDGDALSPDGVERTKKYLAPRDEGNPMAAEDWFHGCGLDVLASGDSGIRTVDLLVESIGVSASKEKFLSTAASFDVEVAEIAAAVERWIDPFLPEEEP